MGYIYFSPFPHIRQGRFGCIFQLYGAYRIKNVCDKIDRWIRIILLTYGRLGTCLSFVLVLYVVLHESYLKNSPTITLEKWTTLTAWGTSMTLSGPPLPDLCNVILVLNPKKQPIRLTTFTSMIFSFEMK